MDFNRANSATYLAGLLAKSFSRALQERGRKLGFAPGQFPVLLELWDEEGLTQKQLLDRLDVEQATLANTLSRMQRDGLVTRQRHPGDRRAVQIFLTEKARAMRETALQAAIDADHLHFEGFRQFEQELMLEYVRMAIDNGRKSGRIGT